MKKLIALIIALTMLFALAACDNLKVETINPTASPEVSADTEPVASEVPEDTNSDALVNGVSVVGPWHLAMDKNDHAALLEYFGTVLRDSAPQMEIKSNGDFSYSLGSAGGAGTWTSEGDMLTATITTYNESKEETVDISLKQENGVNYLAMHFVAFDVVWTQEDGNDELLNGEDIYAHVLNVYKQALTEHWDMTKLQEEGLCYMLMFKTQDTNVDPLEEVGYYFEDINSDNVPELFIGFMDEEDTHILAIYAYDTGNNKEMLIAEGGERYWYSVTPDHRNIFFHSSNSAFNSVDMMYVLNGWTLETLDEIKYDSEANADNPWSRNGESISEADARAVLDGIAGEYTRLPYMAFAALK